MATFIDAARSVTSARGRAFIADVLSQSKLLALLNASSGIEIDESISRWIPNTSTTALQNRAIGSNYSYTVVSPAAAQTSTMAIAGGTLPVDQQYKRDAALGFDINSWFVKELKKRAQIWAREVEAQLMAGTGANNQFEGIDHIVNGTNLPGFAVTRVLDGEDYSVAQNAVNIDLSLAGTNYDEERKRFIEMIFEGFATTDNVRYLLMNSGLFARMNTIARENGWLGTDLTTFGVPVPTFNGIPMVSLTAGAIPLTEDDGDNPANGNTTSLYLVSPGEQRLSLLTNGFNYWDYDSTTNTEAGVEKWEMGAAWKIEEPTAITRLRHILL